MRIWHVFVLALLVVTALFLTGCECDPGTDDELCGYEYCGETTLVDNCDNERTVDCGSCAGDGAICENGQCTCDHLDDEEVCDFLDADCSTATGDDPCGNETTLFCGGCTPPYECEDNSCVCTGESQQQLCAEQGFDCGVTTVEDGCGDERTVDCGSCEEPDECIDNVCDCIAEDDSELCDDIGAECGEASVTDRCNEQRTIDCGDCSSPNECVDNACECVPEEDDELCEQVDGACGTIEVTDQCDNERSVDCQDCPSGDSTFGAVRDGDSGDLIDDADVYVYEWPPPGGDDNRWEWPAGYRSNNPDFSATTSSGAGDFNYEFASDEPICMDDQIETLQPGEWYRIVVDHSDYDPGIFYRLHGQFDSDNCPGECPVGDDTRCHRQDFEIFEEGSTYSRYPNLVTDKRELHEHEYQCALLPPEADEDELIGLRVRLGAANVGPGPFHLEGLADENQVVQYVERTDGSEDTYDVDSEFYDHDSHGHIHFMNWFKMALVDPDDDCMDVEDRSDDCVTHGGDKISYCLHDLEMFDGDVADTYGGESSLFPDPPTCDTSEQGVTQGWIDTYNKHLPGQVIILGEADDMSGIGERWIEGHVDPDQVLQEVERHGNVARITVDVPDDGDALCADSDKVLDCSVPPEDYTSASQHRQCGDYLEHAGVD